MADGKGKVHLYTHRHVHTVAYIDLNNVFNKGFFLSSFYLLLKPSHNI